MKILMLTLFMLIATNAMAQSYLNVGSKTRNGVDYGSNGQQGYRSTESFRNHQSQRQYEIRQEGHRLREYQPKSIPQIYEHRAKDSKYFGGY